ncbi:MAG: hypothetical protein RL136_2443, partial [Planctomycetota bacterium]
GTHGDALGRTGTPCASRYFFPFIDA